MATYEDLAGKVVVVTGANGGMGAAIAAVLGDAGAALWLCSSASSFTTGHVLTVEGGMLVS